MAGLAVRNFAHRTRMQLTPTDLRLGLAFFWAFLVALFAVPSIIRIAHLKNLLDQPNGRTVHVSLTPRLGGVAVYAGFLSALTIFAPLQNGVQELLAGCTILFLIGLKDDLVSVSAFKKFVGQLLATGVVMFMADIRITSFQGIFGIHDLPVGLSYAFTFVVIVGVTNAINLIDGLDGLAGSLVIIMVSTFGIYFYRFGGTAYGNYAYVALCTVGGMLGFLRYNFHRATIFMGDTGSLVCGFIVSILAIQFIQLHPVGHTAPSVALGILFVPLFDTLRVSILRVLNGQSPFAPDKNHIHHRILAMGFKQMTAVLILAALNLAVVLFVVTFYRVGNLMLLGSLIGFSLLLSAVLGVYHGRLRRRLTASPSA